VSVAARTFGVPLALLEPNGAIGLANRLTAPFVQRAYTAFREAERHFAPNAVLRSGVPIRGGFDPRPYVAPTSALRVLVLGGSQGAKSLNETVPEALARVRSRAEQPIEVVHQCGPAHGDAVTTRYAELSAAQWARVVPFIDDMPQALTEAHLVIGRAGASAVSEICAVGRPSLLVPYPYAAGDHQRINGEALEADGAARCVVSTEATVDRIAAEVQRFAEEPAVLARMAESAMRRGRPHAARVIAEDLLKLAGLAGPLQSADASEVDDAVLRNASSGDAVPRRAPPGGAASSMDAAVVDVASFGDVALAGGSH
jgi:UDP-N-acetylglucosamine--N-acetylmuramyl-(pentapeptide) pyrophosphoryl-undecaprenol N-acetylglucosamine transferase